MLRDIASRNSLIFKTLKAMKHLFAALAGLAFSIFFNPIFAQKTAGKTLYGIVTNDKEELLIGATVFWKGTTTGVVTDTTAHFRIPRPDGPATLVVRYVGHTPAEVEVLPTEDSLWIEIAGVTEIQQVTVTGHGFGNSISMLDPRNVRASTAANCGKRRISTSRKVSDDGRSGRDLPERRDRREGNSDARFARDFPANSCSKTARRWAASPRRSRSR